MGWAVHYREFEIYPSLVPVRDGDKGIVGFQPLAHVVKSQSREWQEHFVEVPVARETCFKDASEASEYILSRAKKLIDDGVTF